MPGTVISAETVDDLTREAIEAILKDGRHIEPTKGKNQEILGVTLELTKPRARLSRTESRGKPFSCLGELCWYLSGSNDIGPIEYYVPDYRKYSENGAIFGGYGPRLFSMRGVNQLRNVIELLRAHPTSRRAVIQLFNAEDLVYDAAVLAKGHLDIPCTCSFQFFVREGALNLITYMRSNDVWLGLTHDMFCFTMLQEIVARDLGCELGPYTHIAGSLHLYDAFRPRAERLLEEGWQSTTNAMPAMPAADPWPSIETLLSAERAIRAGDAFPEELLLRVDPYWADLVRLFETYRLRNAGMPSDIDKIRGQMSSHTYDIFLAQAALVAERKAKTT